MKENKNIIIGVIIVIIVIILGCFVGCKLFNVVKYKTDFTNEEYKDIVNRLQVKGIINVKSTLINDDEYINYDGLKIRNDFKDYEIVHNDDNHIAYENKEKNILISISGLTESIVDKIKNDDFLKLKEKDLVYILKKNNIKNDYDLIKYISNQKTKNNNIFTSTKKMKENYFMYFATYNHMSVGENISLIEGDYEGYILNMYDIKSIHIIKDNKTYAFTLSNVSDSYVKELLSTIRIEDN